MATSIPTPSPAMPVAAPDQHDLVTVVMSNYRGARWLSPAIGSVLAQSHRHLELIVVDDASGDDSVAIIRAAMAGDPRLRLIESVVNLGPSGARNLALDAARGGWIAIIDSDDLIHPDRLARLLAAANRLDCDAIADDMIFFGETPATSGCTLLQSLGLTAPRGLSLGALITSDNSGSGLPSYGYLKPLIRRKTLGDLRYDAALRVGEDFDFYARLIARGARFKIVPDALYLYRRHAASLSHRLSSDVLTPRLTAHTNLEHSLPGDDAELSAALRRRCDALTWALRYSQLVEALKGGRPAAVLRLMSRHPRLVKPLWQSLRERLARYREDGAMIARTPLTLVLIPAGMQLPPAVGATVASDARWVTLPPLAEPGERLSAPVAPLAAELSALSCRHDLDVLAVGPEGRHALGMLASVARVRHWPASAADAAHGVNAA